MLTASCVTGGHHGAQTRTPPCGADGRGEEAVAATVPSEALTIASHPDPGSRRAVLWAVAWPSGEDCQTIGDSRYAREYRSQLVGGGVERMKMRE